MARYFFDLESETPDSVGVDLPSIGAAREEATRLISDMIKDHPERLWDDGSWQLTVSNDEHLHLFQIMLTVVDAPAVTKRR